MALWLTLQAECNRSVARGFAVPKNHTFPDERRFVTNGALVSAGRLALWVQIPPPRLYLCTSASSFAAVGFLPGIATFHVRLRRFKPRSAEGKIPHRVDATAVARGTSLSSSGCSWMKFGNHSATMAPIDASVGR